MFFSGGERGRPRPSKAAGGRRTTYWLYWWGHCQSEGGEKRGGLRRALGKSGRDEGGRSRQQTCVCVWCTRTEKEDAPTRGPKRGGPARAQTYAHARARALFQRGVRAAVARCPARTCGAWAEGTLFGASKRGVAKKGRGADSDGLERRRRRQVGWGSKGGEEGGSRPQGGSRSVLSARPPPRGLKKEEEALIAAPLCPPPARRAAGVCLHGC